MSMLAGLSGGLATKPGSFLIVDAQAAPMPLWCWPELAGESDRRTQRALELLFQGCGSRVVLDILTNTKLYEFAQIEFA
ncbi:MAG TPA: hypothetical protein VMU26_22645 [Candidatus Polarisedimenticolia bacterium]|nr:hypothetical protein [Candidatus Polarisedimenticolia bacterium]